MHILGTPKVPTGNSAHSMHKSAHNTHRQICSQHAQTDRLTIRTDRAASSMHRQTSFQYVQTDQLPVCADRSAHSGHRQISSQWAQTDQLGVSHCMIISNAASGSPPIILAASLCPLKPISARRAVHRSSFLFLRCWMEAVLRLAVARLILGAFCAADLPLHETQTVRMLLPGCDI